MIKGQKEAVVELVKSALPGFVPFKDIALVMLTATQLEDIKLRVTVGIQNCFIEYSKDPNNSGEVVPYARSMVMNHLKKAKELNGNQVYTTNPSVVQSNKENKALSGIQMDLLPEELRNFVKTLI